MLDVRPVDIEIELGAVVAVVTGAAVLLAGPEILRIVRSISVAIAISKNE